MNGTALWVEFDRSLNADSASAGSAFTVKATASGDTTKTISGTSAAVTISGARASVTLASAVAAGDSVTVSYAPPSAKPLQAADGHEVAAFSDQSVDNGTGDTTPPTLQSASVNGAMRAPHLRRDSGRRCVEALIPPLACF